MAGLESQSTRLLNEKKLLAAQLYIQNNLNGDLTLQTISQVSGISASHFHRLFKQRLGETLKQYTDRLRVEKSLYDIFISDLNLLQIALRYGFKNPETYSRVFRRHIGQAPSHYLKQRRRIRSAGENPVEHPAITTGLRSSVDPAFAVTRLARLHLAFIRHIGPYQNVPLIADSGDTLWRELEVFAAQELQTAKPFVYIGIPQDSPATTDPLKQRFDACIVVDRPFQARGRIGCQTISPRYHGVLTHAGPYATLSEAYVRLFQQCSGLDKFEIAPGMPFELLLNISATSIEDHTWTELYLPLKLRGE